MAAPQLGIDPEDLGFNILPAVEHSFGIKFTDAGFHERFTYGELVELVQRKLPAASATDCTTQQAFYKLRRALRPMVGEVEIGPATRLVALSARRRKLAAQLKAALGMDLERIFWSGWLVLGVALLFVASLFGLYFNLLAGIVGIGLTILLGKVGNHFGSNLRCQTVGELAEHMASCYYRQSRRHPDTVNLSEVKARLDHLFVDMNGLEAAQLVPEAVL